jgi:hypothetical protein
LCHLESYNRRPGTRALAAIIRHNTSIRDLAFNHCVFDDDAWINLATAIQRQQDSAGNFFLSRRAPSGRCWGHTTCPGSPSTRLHYQASKFKFLMVVEMAAFQSSWSHWAIRALLTWLDLSNKCRGYRTHCISLMEYCAPTRPLLHLDLTHCYIADEWPSRSSWRAFLETPNFESSDLVAIRHYRHDLSCPNCKSFVVYRRWRDSNREPFGDEYLPCRISSIFPEKTLAIVAFEHLGGLLSKTKFLRVSLCCLENVGSDGMKALFQALQTNEMSGRLVRFDSVLGGCCLG